MKMQNEMQHIILNQHFLNMQQKNTMNEDNEAYFDGKGIFNTENSS